MIKFINSILLDFRKVFAREATFKWFVIIIMGLIVKNDGIGVTSIIRELVIDPKHYESLLHFFRSDAWTNENLIKAWINTVKLNAPLLTTHGYKILIGDGVKQSKEGKRMPAVKKHHQGSENSSKAKYMFGHLFGVVSVLIGNPQKQFALSLSATIQDGADIIRKYSDPTTVTASHPVQTIEQAGNIARQIGKTILLLDRYFLSVPTLEKSKEFLDDIGESLIHFVTKAKITYCAYTEAPPYNNIGRPRKKGRTVKLRELFTTATDKFIDAEIYMYGKVHKVQYYCVDLLWGKKLYKELRFVLIKSDSFKPCILVSTLLSLSPTEIIELYSYRYKIEISFKALKHTIFGFAYHFWSSYMPKLNRYHKKCNIAEIELITNEYAKKKILAAFRAIEGFVMCSCIACGILQIVALKYSGKINFSEFRWIRTIRNHIPSEDTVAYYLRKNFFRLLKKYQYIDIMQIIISKQTDSYDQYDKSA